MKATEALIINGKIIPPEEADDDEVMSDVKVSPSALKPPPPTHCDRCGGRLNTFSRRCVRCDHVPTERELNPPLVLAPDPPLEPTECPLVPPKVEARKKPTATQTDKPARSRGPSWVPDAGTLPGPDPEQLVAEEKLKDVETVGRPACRRLVLIEALETVLAAVDGMTDDSKARILSAALALVTPVPGKQ